jgi:hypothetical protein
VFVKEAGKVVGIDKAAISGDHSYRQFCFFKSIAGFMQLTVQLILSGGKTGGVLEKFQKITA